MPKVSRISRELHRQVLLDPQKSKALCLIFRLKSLYNHSVIKNYKHSAIAKTLGISVNTLKKRISILEQMGLVEFRILNGVKYLHLGKIRAPKLKSRKGKFFSPKFKDIDASQLSLADNEKQALLILRTLNLSEIVKSKKRAEDLIILRHQNPQAFQRKGKHLRQSTKEGFTDNGISQSKLRKQCKCGRTMVQKIISCGQSLGHFVKLKAIPMKVLTVKDRASVVAKHLNIRYSYYTEHSFYIQPCNRYILPSIAYNYGITPTVEPSLAF